MSFHGEPAPDATLRAAPPGIVRLAAASAIGTTLEWYDFSIYNVMAALVFNAVFFPQYDPLAGTLLAYSTYAVGYFARPLGGFVFGRLGDRRGRRFVLAATLLLMGTATLLIGLLPDYAHWGLWSPALLVALRFAQGAAIGGEWAGAVLLSVEHGAEHQRGRNGSFAQVGPACGIVLGTATVAAVSQWLPPEGFLRWGWRVPFLASAALVLFGLWLRSRVAETPVFAELQSRQATSREPIREVLRDHWRGLLVSIGARAGPDIFYALLAVYTLSYSTLVLHLPRSVALDATLVGAGCNALCTPWFGALSDRIGRRRVYACGAIMSVAWGFAYFRLMDTRAPWLVGVAVAVGLVLHASMYAPQAAFIAERFPARVRYAGSSMAYTLTGVVAGGVAPLLFSLLHRSYATTLPLSLYVAAALVVTLVALALATRCSAPARASAR